MQFWEVQYTRSKHWETVEECRLRVSSTEDAVGESGAWENAAGTCTEDGVGESGAWENAGELESANGEHTTDEDCARAAAETVVRAMQGELVEDQSGEMEGFMQAWQWYITNDARTRAAKKDPRALLRQAGMDGLDHLFEECSLNTTKVNTSFMLREASDKHNGEGGVMCHVGSKVFLGDTLIVEHIPPRDDLLQLCDTVHGSRASLPWKQAWIKMKHVHQPHGRLSFWVGSETTGVPGCVHDLIAHVVQHPALRVYGMHGDRFAAQMQLYRGSVPAAGACFTDKKAEGIPMHTDNRPVHKGDVDNDTYPIVHVYVHGVASVRVAEIANMRNDVGYGGTAGSMTIMAPGSDRLVKHGRSTASFNGSDEVGMSLILRMHKAAVDVGHWRYASCADNVFVSNGGVTTMDERSTNIGIDWARPAQSRLLVGRTMAGEISRLEPSISACIHANRSFGNELILHLANPDCTRFTPGDVFKNQYCLCVLGFESNDVAGAIKGSKAAGGAVNAWCTPNPKFVVIEKVPVLVGDAVTFCINGSCSQGNGWLQGAQAQQSLVRLVGPAPEWGGSAVCYLGNAQCLCPTGGLWWRMHCLVETDQQLGLWRRWLDEYNMHL